MTVRNEKGQFVQGIRSLNYKGGIKTKGSRVWASDLLTTCTRTSLNKGYAVPTGDVDDVLRLYEDAVGCCRICGRRIRLCIDHCHTTGKLRGFLCVNCNVKLGWFENHKSAVLNYLEIPLHEKV